MSKTRRKTDPTARLSEQMKEVLLWVHKKQPDPQDYVPWQPSIFLSENPTPSKSTALSNTLKRLEERRLLERYSITYKDDEIVRMAYGRLNVRMRTTHVKLSAKGFFFVESLIHDDFNFHDYEAQIERRQEERKINGLRFASTLLYREQLRLMKERGASPEALQPLDEINRQLEQFTKRELETKTRHALSTVNDVLRGFRDTPEDKT